VRRGSRPEAFGFPPFDRPPTTIASLFSPVEERPDFLLEKKLETQTNGLGYLRRIFSDQRLERVGEIGKQLSPSRKYLPPIHHSDAIPYFGRKRICEVVTLPDWKIPKSSPPLSRLADVDGRSMLLKPDAIDQRVSCRIVVRQSPSDFRRKTKATVEVIGCIFRSRGHSPNGLKPLRLPIVHSKNSLTPNIAKENKSSFLRMRSASLAANGRRCAGLLVFAFSSTAPEETSPLIRIVALHGFPRKPLSWVCLTARLHYNSQKPKGGWRSWLARDVDIVEVTGSSPVPPIFSRPSRSASRRG
jgi:hypothetical protein